MAPNFQRPSSTPLPCLLALVLLYVAATRVDAHGIMADPPQRGTLTGIGYRTCHKYVLNPRVCRYFDALSDTLAHFPAGDKNPQPGSALKSQEKFAGDWHPFKPTLPSFRWRAGVCGDHRRRFAPDPPQDHMRGGKFYYGGQITRVYEEGSVVSFRNSIIAHHNGYVEYHLCDIKRCNGEISEECFRKGACYKLKRAYTPQCESGNSPFCGPIDRRNPSRWYLPCRNKQLKRLGGAAFNDYGGKYMRYQLPKGFTCQHCVLHWYWAAANLCNPPGVLEYFSGPNRPKAWGQCPGQGGARGGFTRVQPPCSKKRFPEEYYTCADVRIVPRGASRNLPLSRKVFKSIKIWKRGRRGNPILVREMKHNEYHRFRIRRGTAIDFEAVVLRRPLNTGVTFYRQGFTRKGRKMRQVRMTRDTRRPFFVGGDRSGNPRYWYGAMRRKRYNLIAKAGGQTIVVQLEFIR